MRLLLVEDDEMLGTSLKKGLGLHGYAVEWLKTGAEVSPALADNDFDLVILDINLPDQSGIDVLRNIRKEERDDHVPVLLLTAMNSIDQKIVGLDAGADDYMTKPFDLRELLARLRALSRRTPGQNDSIVHGRDFALDLTNRLVHVGETSFTPSANEMKILTLLMQKPGRLISKERIEETLYGWDGEVDSNTVEVTIYNLRKKIGKDAIVNMRGVGYMVRT